MHVASVTLDEVLRAAARRAASLVPETAGYLALAIGDASARLPYRLDDELVTLTTEGTVRVARGRVAVPPEEGARVLRDLLRRLLAVSAGSMPGLAQAALARPETAPDAVVAAIEAALIPVNRAAARRSLARLARDTARARDAGRLEGGAPAPRVATPLPVRTFAPPVPEPVEPAYEEPEVVVTTPSAPIVAIAASDDACVAAWTGPDDTPSEEPATPFRPELARARDVATPPPEEVTSRLAPLADAEPTAEPSDATTIDPEVVAVVEIAAPVELEPRAETAPHGDAPHDDATAHLEGAAHAEVPPHDDAAHLEGAAHAEVPPHDDTSWREDAPRVEAAAPGPLGAAGDDEAPESRLDRATRALEDALRSGALAAPAAPIRIAPAAPAQRRPWQAELAPAAQSDVDALLARFRPAESVSDATAMRRDLKHLVGIDATQLPPRVSDRAR